jgi:hypothetical protein
MYPHSSLSPIPRLLCWRERADRQDGRRWRRVPACAGRRSRCGDLGAWPRHVLVGRTRRSVTRDGGGHGGATSVPKAVWWFVTMCCLVSAAAASSSMRDAASSRHSAESSARLATPAPCLPASCRRDLGDLAAVLDAAPVPPGAVLVEEQSWPGDKEEWGYIVRSYRAWSGLPACVQLLAAVQRARWSLVDRSDEPMTAAKCDSESSARLRVRGGGVVLVSWMPDRLTYSVNESGLPA